MRKQCRRKVRPVNGPAIRLTDVHARDLAIQAHVAAAGIQDVACINSFIHILTVVTAAMAVDGTADKHSDSIIRTCVLTLESVLKAERITEDQEAYIKTTACFIKDWVHSGRITYRGLKAAKNATKRLDMQLGIK